MVVRQKHLCTSRESNPGRLLGKQKSYHWTTGACSYRKKHLLISLYQLHPRATHTSHQSSMDVLEQRIRSEAAKAQQWLEAHAQSTRIPKITLQRQVMRVAQLDALLLDEEVQRVLSGQIASIFKFFKTNPFEALRLEFEFSIQTMMFLLSIRRNVPSPGNLLQNLHYVPIRLSRTQKSVYFLLGVLGPYMWKKWNQKLTIEGWGGEPSDSFKAKAYRFSRTLDTILKALNTVNFLVFLYNGKYRAILDRILRMQLTYISPRMSRQIAFDFMNQQLVWHSFSEFLLFFLPLINLSRVRRWLKSVLSNNFASRDSPSNDNSCPICQITPITVPVRSNCGHVFCYYCLEGSRLSSSELTCPICSASVYTHKRI